MKNMIVLKLNVHCCNLWQEMISNIAAISQEQAVMLKSSPLTTWPVVTHMQYMWCFKCIYAENMCITNVSGTYVLHYIPVLHV